MQWGPITFVISFKTFWIKWIGLMRACGVRSCWTSAGTGPSLSAWSIPSLIFFFFGADAFRCSFCGFVVLRAKSGNPQSSSNFKLTSAKASSGEHISNLEFQCIWSELADHGLHMYLSLIGVETLDALDQIKCWCSKLFLSFSFCKENLCSTVPVVRNWKWWIFGVQDWQV